MLSPQPFNYDFAPELNPLSSMRRLIVQSCLDRIVDACSSDWSVVHVQHIMPSTYVSHPEC